jgi:elongation factor G
VFFRVDRFGGADRGSVMTVDLSKVRNIGIAAHIDAGKTTTTERILFYSGTTHRMGDVDDGTTTTDFDEQEQARGISIYSAAVTCPWQGHIINVIDTPGHVDFTAEVERSLRVLDGVIAVFDAKEGVEAQSETVWRQANKYNVPRICLMNKMDKMGADFAASINSMRKRLAANPVAVQIPIGAEDRFEGLIDLLKMRAVYYFDEKQGARFEERDIPEDLVDEAQRWRHNLEEKVAETCDELMEKYLSDQPLSEAELVAGLRAATIACDVQPVLCGSALRFKGVQRLLDAVCAFLPSPLDVPPTRAHLVGKKDKETELPPDPNAPLAALLFKIVAEKPVDLCYLRIYSGTLKSASRVFNPATGEKENLTRIFRIFAKKRDQLSEAQAGDIVAVIGLKNSLTGHTLCDAKHPVLLESIEFPETVISRSIEPKSSRDREKLIACLQAIGRQDPTICAEINEETGQMLISGMGELHLDVVVKRMRDDMNVDVNVGQPRVSFRETVTKTAEGDGHFIRQAGGRNHFAEVTIRLEPTGRGESDQDTTFVDATPVGSLLPEYVEAVRQGVRDAALSGIVRGCRVIDWKATLVKGVQRDDESSELAFENAARMAFEAAMRAADAVLLEPVMKVEIVTPDEHFGIVNSDLNARRATITGTDVRGQYRVVDAEVPLRELFGYTTALRSLTQGRASATMEMSHYARATGKGAI